MTFAPVLLIFSARESDEAPERFIHAVIPVLCGKSMHGCVDFALVCSSVVAFSVRSIVIKHAYLVHGLNSFWLSSWITASDGLIWSVAAVPLFLTQIVPWSLLSFLVGMAAGN